MDATDFRYQPTTLYRTLILKTGSQMPDTRQPLQGLAAGERIALYLYYPDETEVKVKIILSVAYRREARSRHALK